jgi:hypothetical protein
MANTFVAINRGLDGFHISDYTIGAGSSAGSDIELRIAAVDGQGKVMTKKDIYDALIGFQRLVESGAIFWSPPVFP